MFEKEPQEPQKANNEAALRAPPSTPGDLGPTTGVLDTGKEPYIEPRQGLVSPPYAEPNSARRKSSNTKEVNGRPNQRTLKEAGFTAVGKPVTPKAKRKGLDRKTLSSDVDQALHIRPGSPPIISDDESLPRSPREHFSMNQRDKERTMEKKQAVTPLQDVNEPDDFETPSKRRKTAGPSIVRSSNTIKARTLPRRPPPTVLHPEALLPEPALGPTLMEAQLPGPPHGDERSRGLAVASSVDDSDGSPTPREVSKAASIDLGAPLARCELSPKNLCQNFLCRRA